MKKILIVDDDRCMLDALPSMLSSHLIGCKILTAPDGAQGKVVVDTTTIDLVITDLSMPVMDGYLLIEYLKKNHPAIPVCVMTAACSPHVVARLRSLGVTHYLEKPFKVEDLSQMITEVL